MESFAAGCAQVLDVGSGSGYLAAVFAQLVCHASQEGQSCTDNGASIGEVTGVEHIPELVELGIANLRKSPVMQQLMRTGQLQMLQVGVSPTLMRTRANVQDSPEL